MTKENKKLPHEKAVEHGKRLINRGNSITQTIQDTQLSHKDILKIKDEGL